MRFGCIWRRKRDHDADTTSRTTVTSTEGAHDVVSDPAHGADEGHDWSDEGGATTQGPATHPQHR